jgi:hypothetical protein
MQPASFRPGELIEFDGLLAAVVATAGEPMPYTQGAEIVPEGHIALWFGDPGAKRISQGGTGGHAAVIHTVPTELCRPTSASVAIARGEH